MEIKKRLKDQEKIDIVLMYSQGLSCIKIAKTYGVTKQAITQLLKRRNIKMKNKKDYKL